MTAMAKELELSVSRISRLIATAEAVGVRPHFASQGAT